MDQWEGESKVPKTKKEETAVTRKRQWLFGCSGVGVKMKTGECIQGNFMTQKKWVSVVGHIWGLTGG